MVEVWRDIDGYDGAYQVSNFGRVRSFKQKTPRILKPIPNRNGYLCVKLLHNGKDTTCKIHRLVAQAFIPNLENKPQINHINGVKTDNRIENLEWCTHAENARHAFCTGLNAVPKGTDSPNAKLTNEQVRFIRDNPDKLTCAQLARLFGVDHKTVADVQLGLKYRSADGKIRTEKLPNPRRLPDDVREEIRRLYVRGSAEFGLATLANKYGCSQQTICRIIHEK